MYPWFDRQVRASWALHNDWLPQSILDSNRLRIVWSDAKSSPQHISPLVRVNLGCRRLKLTVRANKTHRTECYVYTCSRRTNSSQFYHTVTARQFCYGLSYHCTALQLCYGQFMSAIKTRGIKARWPGRVIDWVCMKGSGWLQCAPI